MSRLARTNPRGQMVLGLLVVVIGLLFLIDNLGWIHLDLRRMLVPGILLVVGVLKLTQARSNSGNVIGVVLVCVGAVGILRGIGFLDFDWRDIWPVVLIIAGIGIVYRASMYDNVGSIHQVGKRGGDDDKGAFVFPDNAGQQAPRAAGDDTVLNFVSVLGTSNRRVATQDFRGGEVTAILGSADLDLRQASINGDAVLNVFSLVGGITIKVPVDWAVVMDGTAIIGGFEEKTAQPHGSGKRLIVRGYAILGGLEVRN
ncbi:hypothetical protein ASF61_19760 [Duganella sp. Leaf126]|uniref:LiaI-LiaF-like domain-containing protein n=1 Tax=Duganella sp. Leaf126 TaxID=1736266 RepID=UPI0006FB5ABC|nr:DUF5668 domain-containing protein [Duganella sp. Leaf126]KQQ45883.1 hypothetical protein ASF61_19760 [Duganella sp. Leaf126]